jgi:hypothetical protein
MLQEIYGEETNEYSIGFCQLRILRQKTELCSTQTNKQSGFSPPANK